MAIQNRRGAYGNFDPTKMVAGEFAVVQDNDPNSSTGRSLYICFEPGVVKRVADYEDIQDMVAEVAEQYVEDFDEAVTALTTLIPATEQAKDDANAAAAAVQTLLSGDNAELGFGYGVCSTSSLTNAKEVSITDFSLAVGGIVAITFTYKGDSFSTLNINNTGAKTVKYRGASVPDGLIMADDTAILIYDGTYYQLISVDRVQPLWLDFGTISSLPVTKNNIHLRDNMKCTCAVLGTPSAQGSDWTVTTNYLSVTISGTINGSTTLSLLLESTKNVTYS